MSNFDKEKYFDVLETFSDLEWSFGDGVELKAVLYNPAVVKALSILTEDAKAMGDQFDGLDLTQQAGVAAGIKLQGRREGVKNVIQRLVDFAEEGNREDG
jgi:hypothetical protein